MLMVPLWVPLVSPPAPHTHTSSPPQGHNPGLSALDFELSDQSTVELGGRSIHRGPALIHGDTASTPVDGPQPSANPSASKLLGYFSAQLLFFFFEAMEVLEKWQPGNNDHLCGPTGAQWGSKKSSASPTRKRGPSTKARYKKKKQFCYFFFLSHYCHLSSFMMVGGGKKEETPNHHVDSPQFQVRLTTAGGKNRGKKRQERKMGLVSVPNTAVNFHPNTSKQKK